MVWDIITRGLSVGDDNLSLNDILGGPSGYTLPFVVIKSKVMSQYSLRT